MNRALRPWLAAAFAATIPGFVCILGLLVPGVALALSGVTSYTLANIGAAVWLVIVVAALVRLGRPALWLLASAPFALAIPVVIALFAVACVPGGALKCPGIG